PRHQATNGHRLIIFASAYTKQWPKVCILFRSAPERLVQPEKMRSLDPDVFAHAKRLPANRPHGSMHFVAGDLRRTVNGHVSTGAAQLTHDFRPSLLRLWKVTRSQVSHSLPNLCDGRQIL